jgi:hypothetical protein
MLWLKSLEQEPLLQEKNKLIQDVPGGKVSILGDHSIRHSKKKSLCEHMSYSERFPR